MDILEKAQADGAKIHLRTAGINVMSGKRDLNGFTEEIDESEKILCIITGKLVQVSNDRSRGMFGNSKRATGTDSKGVMVITNQKAVFMDKRMFGKQTTIIDGEDVKSVTTAGGIMSARIEIMTYGIRYDITDLKKDAATDAVAAINTLKKAQKGNKGGTVVNQAASGMEEVKKAKELLDSGIISKEEFEKIKKKHI